MVQNGAKNIKMEEGGADEAQPVQDGGEAAPARGMRFFSGKYSLKIDEKGRFNIPSKCRDLLGEDVYMYVISDTRIQVWSQAAAEAGPWADLAHELELHRTDSSKGLSYSEYTTILGCYIPVTVDAQKRIILPPELRKTAAGGKGDQVLTGCGDHLMLRTVEDWENAQQKASAAMARFNARYD